MPSFKTVAVIGAGAWGTALAGVAARAGRDVVLYARSSATATKIAATRSNPKLPGVKLEASVKVADDIAAAAAADIVLIATPAQNLREAVARGLPTAVTLAAQDETLAGALVQALGSSTFRPYHTTDVRGVEIGGAAKNVRAIAAGIVVGRKLGASAQGALTTRGFSELTRLGRACGARGETMAGLSGLGDLILTCSSPQSRNFAL